MLKAPQVYLRLFLSGKKQRYPPLSCLTTNPPVNQYRETFNHNNTSNKNSRQVHLNPGFEPIKHVKPLASNQTSNLSLKEIKNSADINIKNSIHLLQKIEQD